MISVEFTGVPGSGKSTLRNEVLHRLRESDCPVVDYANPYSAFFSQTWASIVPNSVCRFVSNRYLNWGFDHSEILSNILHEHPELLPLAIESIDKVAESPEQRQLLLKWTIDTFIRHRIIMNASSQDGILLIDEGPIHRSLSLFVNASICNVDSIQKYIDSVPLPDVIIKLDVPIEVCLQRIYDRNSDQPKRLMNKSEKEMKSFLQNSDRLLCHIENSLHGENIDIHRIRNDCSIEDSTEKIVNILQKR